MDSTETQREESELDDCPCFGCAMLNMWLGMCYKEMLELPQGELYEGMAYHKHGSCKHFVPENDAS